ncbi:MAG TPA: hypothetical protein VLH84_02425 [Patescibacteria group bacterium]|nr:hypothetical protein [Patescibacteria group bacterium]
MTEDTTTPEKPKEDDGVHRLEVHRRPIMSHDIVKSVPVSNHSDEPPEEQASPEPGADVAVAPVKHAPIVPLDHKDDDDDDKGADVGTKTDGNKDKADDKPAQSEAADTEPKVPDHDTVEPAESHPAPEPQPESSPAEPPADKTAPAESQPDAPDPADTTPEDKTAEETRKAVEEVAKATKRDHEVEELIDSQRFFVPINTEAHKRSIKVSFGLVLLLLLLAGVLIDLMLDSDTILLLQKIPHTHFFGN